MRVAAAVLAAYTAVLFYLVPWRLAGASWTRRSPLLAIGVWQAASVSALAAVGLVGAVLIVPLLTVGHTLIALVQACGFTVTPLSRSAPALLADAVGVTLLTVTVVRVGLAVRAVAVPRRRARRRHAESLRLVACRDRDRDVLILDHPAATAYCLPGRDGAVVLSSGAVQQLPPAHLSAVLAHERAHLRQRHHLVTAVSTVLARAFPRLPLFIVGDRELHVLIEMAADDAAARHNAPAAVAAAILDLAASQPPAATLAMAGPTAVDRARRLLRPTGPLSPIATFLGAAVVAGLLLMPVAAPTIPALLDDAQHCPPKVTSSTPAAPGSASTGLRQ